MGKLISKVPTGDILNAEGGAPRVGGGYPSPRRVTRPAPRPPERVEQPDTSGHVSSGFWSKVGKAIGIGATGGAAVSGSGSYFRDLQEWQVRRSPNPPEVDTRGDRMTIHIGRDSTIARPFAFKLGAASPSERVPLPPEIERLPAAQRQKAAAAYYRGRIEFDYERGVESVGEEAYAGVGRVVGPRPADRKEQLGFISHARDRRRPGLIEPPAKEGIWQQPKVTITVEPAGRGAVQLALRTHVRSSSDARYRDTKYGKKLVGVFEQVITATYGVMSEAQDVYENFTENLWYQLRDGRVVKAVKIADGNPYEATRMYLRGEAQLDTAGFAMDYAISQMSDYGYALTSNMQRKAVVALGKDAGWKTNRFINKGIDQMAHEMGVQDVRSEWVRSSEDWLRSFDGQRSARVRRLFSS